MENNTGIHIMNAEKFLGDELCKQIKTRRFAKGTYTFMANRVFSLIDSTPVYYVTCITPKNGFGYSDTVFRTRLGGDDAESVVTEWRYLQPWILREIAKEFTKIEIQFSMEVY